MLKFFYIKYKINGYIINWKLSQDQDCAEKQTDNADEVYVLLIQQLLKPDNEGVLMAGINIYI